jgi:hypothetical protein
VSKIDQAKLLMRARKLQKELQKEIIIVEAGEGAVKVEITGEQKIKKSAGRKTPLKKLLTVVKNWPPRKCSL